MLKAVSNYRLFFLKCHSFVLSLESKNVARGHLHVFSEYSLQVTSMDSTMTCFDSLNMEVFHQKATTCSLVIMLTEENNL